MMKDDLVIENEKPTIFIPYEKRDNTWKFLYIVYKILRVIEVAVWFYFVPFIALIGSYGIPYMLGTTA